VFGRRGMRDSERPLCVHSDENIFIFMDCGFCKLSESVVRELGKKWTLK
jgi:hypothetical protein